MTVLVKVRLSETLVSVQRENFSYILGSNDSVMHIQVVKARQRTIDNRGASSGDGDNAGCFGIDGRLGDSINKAHLSMQVVMDGRYAAFKHLA